jgi:hypothetical protein
MDTVHIITCVLSLAALVVALLILSRVNALFKELRTPIVKKFSPDMNLRRDARKPVSQQDLAARGKQEPREERKPRGERQERANRGDRPQGARPERTERSDRPQRQDRQNRFNKPQGAISNEGKLLSDSVPDAGLSVDAAQAAAGVLPAAPAPVIAAAPTEGRRPLAPRSPSSHPAPAHSAPVAPVAVQAAPAPVAPQGEGEEAPLSFDRSKMSFGRRSQVKKEVVPEAAEEAAA